MARTTHRAVFVRIARAERPVLIRRIDFFRWTLTQNSRIVFLVRAPLSGGCFRADFCVQPRKLRCKSADLVALPLNL